jgi:hypothetical protein
VRPTPRPSLLLYQPFFISPSRDDLGARRGRRAFIVTKTRGTNARASGWKRSNLTG